MASFGLYSGLPRVSTVGELCCETQNYKVSEGSESQQSKARRPAENLAGAGGGLVRHAQGQLYTWLINGGVRQFYGPTERITPEKLADSLNLALAV